MDNGAIILIIISWYLAGCCNGIMDAIKYHDAYKYWGPFWSNDSWKRLYDGDYNLFERIFGASFDGWHVLKYTMMLLFLLSLVLSLSICLIFKQVIIIAVLCLASFIIGFKTTYK